MRHSISLLLAVPLALLAQDGKIHVGSWDGRIVIMAAQKFNADSTGVELDDALYKQSSQRIKTMDSGTLARIVHGDLPAKILDIDDDGEGRSHRLYLYRR